MTEPKSKSTITLELHAADNSRTVPLHELESWIEEVKKHTDADNVNVEILVGLLQVKR